MITVLIICVFFFFRSLYIVYLINKKYNNVDFFDLSLFNYIAILTGVCVISI